MPNRTFIFSDVFREKLPIKSTIFSIAFSNPFQNSSNRLFFQNVPALILLTRLRYRSQKPCHCINPAYYRKIIRICILLKVPISEFAITVTIPIKPTSHTPVTTPAAISVYHLSKLFRWISSSSGFLPAATVSQIILISQITQLRIVPSNTGSIRFAYFSKVSASDAMESAIGNSVSTLTAKTKSSVSRLCLIV